MATSHGQLAPSTKPDPELRADPGPRDDGRDDGRVAQRSRRRDANLKYHLDQTEMKAGQDYLWAATKVRGMPNPRFKDFYAAGWRPVPAKEHPDLSGLHLMNDQMMIDLGFIPEVKPEGPIVIDDQMLMIRPKVMSQRAQAEAERQAKDQVDDYLQTLRGRSEHAIGAQRTRISRNFGPADEAPSDAQMEMG